ncbi:hypothetical protein GCM10007073_04030 [Micrococcus flavus]|nr:hypothetical protein GCM10007073_04030 [Micrococcus flavus]
MRNGLGDAADVRAGDDPPTAEADRIPVTATRPDGHPAATARPHPGLTRATFLPSNQGERQADMREGPGHHVMSRPFHAVDAMERCGNRRPRVERLVSAWNRGIRPDADGEGEADDALIGASAEPSKRPRPRLTDSEVDAMRTARERGVSVKVIAMQFGIHRGTVWAKTR